MYPWIWHENLYIYIDNYYQKTSHCICILPWPIKIFFMRVKNILPKILFSTGVVGTGEGPMDFYMLTIFLE
jgi:hypothetical protein